jgi:hypothetical protein
VNVGNDQPYQIPGKLSEYFGAQRPILHLSSGSDDPGAALLRRLNRGLVARNEPNSIRAALADLYASWRAGDLETRFDLSMQSVLKYSWLALGGRLLEQCRLVTSESRITGNGRGTGKPEGIS